MRVVGRNESAISPVVGVILMVAITVSVSAVVYTFVSNTTSVSYEKAASVKEFFERKGNTYVEFDEPSDDEVRVKEVYPDAVLCICKYALYEKNTDKYVDENGVLRDTPTWLQRDAWKNMLIKYLEPSTTYIFYVVIWCNCDSAPKISEKPVEVTTKATPP